MDATALDRTDLTALHDHLRALRNWAEIQLDGVHDRKDIAEHMTAVLDALLGYETPPPRPF
jgi:hypothetical protein